MGVGSGGGGEWGVFVLWHTQRSDLKTWESQFSPPSMWIQRLDLGSLGFMAGVFLTESSHGPSF